MRQQDAGFLSQHGKNRITPVILTFSKCERQDHAPIILSMSIEMQAEQNGLLFFLAFSILQCTRESNEALLIVTGLKIENSNEQKLLLEMVSVVSSRVICIPTIHALQTKEIINKYLNL